MSRLIRLIRLRGGSDAASAATPVPSRGDRGTFPGPYLYPTPSTRSTRLLSIRTGSNVLQTTAAAKGHLGLLSATLCSARTTPMTMASSMAIYRRQGLRPNSGRCLLRTTAMVSTPVCCGRKKSDCFGESYSGLCRRPFASPANKPWSAHSRRRTVYTSDAAGRGVRKRPS